MIELNKIYCGDCLELMKEVPDKSVDLILTDPPYGINYQSARRIDKTQWKPKIANDKTPFIWWINDAFKKLKDGGSVISFCRFDSWSVFETAFKTAGFEIKGQIVWDKQTHGTGDLRGTPGQRHELAIFATKGRFLFQGKRPQSLISVPRVLPQKLAHPNEKPILLMENIVEHYCQHNGVVLDLFSGVAPVALACIKTGRNFIGFELSQEYCDIANERIRKAYGDE